MKLFAVLLLTLVFTAGTSGQDGDVNTAVPDVDEDTIAPGETTTANPTPTTTTLAPTPTTTLKPSGDDEAPVNTYALNQTGTVCLLVKMAVKLNFTFNQSYPEGNETKTRSVNVLWNVPNDTKVDNTMSKCALNNNTNTQLLVLGFYGTWTLSIHVSKDAKKQVKVDNFTLHYMESDGMFHNITQPAGQDVTTSAQTDDFTWTDAGFKCSSMDDVTKFSRGNMTQLNDMKTFDVMIEAFRDKKDATFGKSFTYCAADTTVSNIVPIAVGAALAGLVLIVLIAYLIGRSRNKRGYESV